MAVFLYHKLNCGDVGVGHSQDPSIKAILCLADRAIITDLYQLSKLNYSFPNRDRELD